MLSQLTHLSPSSKLHFALEFKKCFRKELGNKSYSSLGEYAEQFISYLDSNTHLFPEEEQEKSFHSLALAYLFSVRKRIDKEIEVTTHKKGRITSSEIENIISKNIKKLHDQFEKYKTLPTVSQGYDEQTLRKYDKILNKAIKEAFTKW